MRSAVPDAKPCFEFSSGNESLAWDQLSWFPAAATLAPSAPCRLHRTTAWSRGARLWEKQFLSCALNQGHTSCAPVPSILRFRPAEYKSSSRGLGSNHRRDQVMHEPVVVCPTADPVEPGLEQPEFGVPKLSGNSLQQEDAEDFFFQHMAAKQIICPLTRKSGPCSLWMVRRKRTATLRSSAVYHPRDLISSLKKCCTPSACGAEPPSFSKRRMWSAM
jgi:hypothetical protein